jgi:23S rRNA pseudouridine2604 synthase
VTEVRLSKYLSSKGLCSRREADRYIADGLVTVDGEVVLDAWFRVLPEHNVVMASSAQKAQQQMLTVLLNKPLGYVSAQAEEGQVNSARLLQSENYYGGGKPPRINRKKAFAPAGRLDINSTGLLVLTQDGRVAGKLIGNNVEIEKEYLVRHKGAVSDSQISEMRSGLQLDGRDLKTAKIQRVNEDQIRLVLIEGKKRQVRRMCEAVGLELFALKRVRVGKVRLGDLPLGKWRTLAKGEEF